MNNMVVDPKPLAEKFRKEQEELTKNLETFIDETLMEEMKIEFTLGKQFIVYLSGENYGRYQRLGVGLWESLIEKYKEVGWTVSVINPGKQTVLNFTYE